MGGATRLGFRARHQTPPNVSWMSWVGSGHETRYIGHTKYKKMGHCVMDRGRGGVGAVAKHFTLGNPPLPWQYCGNEILLSESFFVVM